MRVHIQNFQSLQDVHFEVSGFTVLIGRSNLGKSAAIRAIEGALFNAPVDAYVRDGASSLMVHLSSPDFDIKWRKGGGHNDYEVDGVSYESVGRDVPDVIRQKGFRDIEVNKNQLRVQVSDQFHPLFLLDCSGTDAAQAISDVNRIYEIQSAQEAVDKDRRSVKAEIKVREKDLISAKTRALQIESKQDAVEVLRGVVARGTALSRERTRMERVRADVGAHARIRAGIQARSPVTRVDIPTIPSPHYKGAVRDARLYGILRKKILAHKEIPLPTLPKPPSPQMKRDLILGSKLQKALNHVQGIQALSVPQIPDRTSLSLVLKSAQTMKSLVQKMQGLREEVLSLNAQITGLEQQIRDTVPTCPTCGQATSHQHA